MLEACRQVPRCWWGVGGAGSVIRPQLTPSLPARAHGTGADAAGAALASALLLACGRDDLRSRSSADVAVHSRVGRCSRQQQPGEEACIHLLR